MFDAVFRGSTVLITGHTGFKGSWLAIWLGRLGARVVGYALDPPTTPNLFTLAGLADGMTHVLGDVRDTQQLAQALTEHRPDFIFHLAAQPLVRRSHEMPLDTIAVNVLGAASLLDAIRSTRLRTTVVVVTSDKCYERCDGMASYREEDALGGHDPYSASKAAAELVVSSYRRSFFPPCEAQAHGVLLASARAGNVIGGGDWASDRIVPDAIRAFSHGEILTVRNPDSVRPWQHVLEPLSGYLWLAARLSGAEGDRFAESWNFGPQHGRAVPVRELVGALARFWGDGQWRTGESPSIDEARSLSLNIDKATTRLGWQPVWELDTAVCRTVRWYRRTASLPESACVLAACLDDIEAYEADGRAGGLSWSI